MIDEQSKQFQLEPLTTNFSSNDSFNTKKENDKNWNNMMSPRIHANDTTLAI